MGVGERHERARIEPQKGRKYESQKGEEGGGNQKILQESGWQRPRISFGRG